MILACHGINKSFGDNVIVAEGSFHIEDHEKAALVGPNGAGKTTLFKMIVGELPPDGGDITLTRGKTLGYLAQHQEMVSGNTIYEEVRLAKADIIAMEQQIRSIELELKNLEGEALSARLNTYHRLTAAFDRENGYAYESEITGVLKGLGFGEEDFSKPVDTLSGGQKTRVSLGKLLLTRPDILLLDEPTNHLDLNSIAWLETYLLNYPGAVLIVSHDRYFLDRVCSEIIEIDNQQVYSYKGNYSYYLEKRQERIEATNAEIARANNLYRTELEWMRRMPQARGHKARYREEAFYELEKVAKQRFNDGNVKLDMKASYIGSKIFEADHLYKRFGDLKILEDFSYIFARYEKMGIVGNNGTGKSTFIKILMGEQKPDSGTLDIGETVRFGYYSQDGLKFDEQMKVIDVVQDIAEVIELGNGKKLTASQFLQHFLFTPETQHSYVYKLSGGERRRLYLCTVLMRNPNFLVLDEPTNDLDIITLQVLEEYLQNFKGCVIVVSHDRYFMDKVVDHLLVFKGQGDIRDFPGNYSDYRDWREAKEQREKEAEKPKEEKTARVRLNDKRKMSFKEKKEFEQLEQEIAGLEQEKADIEAALCSGTLGVEELTEKSKRLPELNDLIDEKTMRWLELSEIEG